MENEPKDMIVLGTIKSGAKDFDKIRRIAKLEPEELNKILEKLEERGLIKVEEKKGWLGKKIEIKTTEKGDNEVEHRIHELEANWGEMVALYKAGNKDKLNDYMDNNRSILPMMMFFGIMDIMMFSMMFSMIGAQMNDYVPADQIPEGTDTGGESDFSGDGDGGGFDFDIGF
ncbi:hypothetical protein C6988_03875 [Nitrosopumilus sp. b1]|uniref:hypothetical protein n=1 Tax=Nitrosopumilus sp. b1 TaxID=2109907 RepID=UPI0015F5EA62|nr:hypothetical protein [Nitrosopumilus sp. b1]KAF6243415.1 hypothetical protein C6988_03875 [Nitrosopumilus sp. b1]